MCECVCSVTISICGGKRKAISGSLFVHFLFEVVFEPYSGGDMFVA